MKGSKYIQGQDVAEIAKVLRSDIKQAVKAGLLPTGLKVGVTISRFSMGCSLSVRVTALPAGFPVLAGDPECPHAKAPETRALLEQLEEMVDAHRRDDSDPSTDYFSVNFFKHVDVDWRLEKAIREAGRVAA